MPGRNRTGPYGAGPRTGWGSGDCAGDDRSRPRGGGRGRHGGGGGHRWRHRFRVIGEPGCWRSGDRWTVADSMTEGDALRAERRELERELAEARERLATIEEPGDTASRGDG